jgi:hypothetical protein
MRLGLPLERASQTQITRARIVFSVIDAAHQAATKGLAMAAFRQCGLFPYKADSVLKSRYIRDSAEDPEAAERLANPERHTTGPQVLTSAEFLSRLEKRGRTALLEIDIAGIAPDDGDFVNEEVPDVVVRDTMVEDGEDDTML